MCKLICASVVRKPPKTGSHVEDQLLVVNMYIPFVLTVSQKLRDCMLFCCASFLTRELKNCDGAFCTQKFKYICDTEAFEDDSVSPFSYFASVKNLTQAGEKYVLINKCKCRCSTEFKFKVAVLQLVQVVWERMGRVLDSRPRGR